MAKRYSGELDGYIRERYEAGETPYVIWLQILEDYEGNPPLAMGTVYNRCKQFNIDTQRAHEVNFSIDRMMADIRHAVMNHLHLLPADLLRVDPEGDYSEGADNEGDYIDY